MEFRREPSLSYDFELGVVGRMLRSEFLWDGFALNSPPTLSGGSGLSFLSPFSKYGKSKADF